MRENKKKWYEKDPLPSLPPSLGKRSHGNPHLLFPKSSIEFLERERFYGKATVISDEGQASAVIPVSGRGRGWGEEFAWRIMCTLRTGERKEEEDTVFMMMMADL